mgnify:CR=1 FL=1
MYLNIQQTYLHSVINFIKFEEMYVKFEAIRLIRWKYKNYIN